MPQEPPHQSRPVVLLLASLLAACAIASVARATGDTTDRMMVLTVDLTREGKKVEPATPEHSVYYVPVFLGYSERGEQAQHYQRKPPSEEDIQQALMASLARKGYLVASHDFPPTLTISFEYGSISPVRVGRTVVNASEIRALVVGRNTWDLSNRYAGYTREMMSTEARHFLVISAFEYQRSNKKKPDVLLWTAHATTDAWGNYYDEIVKTLIATAEPGLGREVKPGTIWKAGVPHVIIGKPEVKEDGASPKAK